MQQAGSHLLLEAGSHHPYFSHHVITEEGTHIGMLKERNNVLWTGGLATMSGLGMNNCNNVKGKKEEFVQLLQSQYINGFSLGNG